MPHVMLHPKKAHNFILFNKIQPTYYLAVMTIKAADCMYRFLTRNLIFVIPYGQSMELSVYHVHKSPSISTQRAGVAGVAAAVMSLSTRHTAPCVFIHQGPDITHAEVEVGTQTQTSTGFSNIRPVRQHKAGPPTPNFRIKTSPSQTQHKRLINKQKLGSRVHFIYTITFAVVCTVFHSTAGLDGFAQNALSMSNTFR